MSLPPVLRDRLRLPVIGSPLFIVSGPGAGDRPVQGRHRRLVPVAERAAGLAAGRVAGADHRESWPTGTARIPRAPSAPFAVNQIVHKTNNRLEEDVELCAKYKVPVVITSLGAREDVNDAVHGWGGVVLHDVINDSFARKAIEKGADGLIPVAAGAGGHAGRLSPFAIIQELREWFDGPIALSGAIANGACGAGGAGDGRGPRLHRLGLHRHAGGARRPRATRT